ncbi:MAG: bifunctional diaminohydroxyphosphoribosylaminopyrimidine deaminase/5-amino-6-(5-phosphoribosylamino)uracil reductase RibD [Chlorobium sp.]|nr:bifunctional diaminohydroxyphosphoribosylaminopyrimidine deaminase/5-amino-6-(5-phosphoribosylamino)uracil reductase RibD [Chlorobium sp.]
MPLLDDDHFMRRSLELALLGAGRVSPNPMVGAVLVCNGEIIGEGYHHHFGAPHAEVEAIASIADEQKLRDATLYVTLEPCAHYGKTPPCSDLIIEKGIPRVVIGCRDPYTEVSGKGVAKLMAAGVTVTEGVLEAECRKSNEAFIKSHTAGLPFVTIKLAQTLDGKIATSLGASHWISGDESRYEVHRLRSIYDAVLIGEATVRADNAHLTVRHCAGRNPLRVVLDRHLRLPSEAKIFDNEASTILFASSSWERSPKVEQLHQRGVSVLFVDEHAGELDLRQVLHELHNRNILSVMVEGGSRLSASFIRAGLADKITMFIAPKLFGGDALSAFAPLGINMPDQAINLRFEPPHFFGFDMQLEAYIDLLTAPDNQAQR